jgi:hypothetical protein
MSEIGEGRRERLRSRLISIVINNCYADHRGDVRGEEKVADAILREFRLQPVAVGKVTGEGEVEGI